MEKIRVVIYGLGETGKSIARLLLEKEDYELVGAIDIDPRKIGRDLGSILGPGKKFGIPVSQKLEEVLIHRPEVIIHATVSLLSEAAEQILACVDSGADVISTCEELAYPYRKYPELADKLERQAKAKGVRLLATGINPGFIMDTLPLLLTAACQKVKSVRVCRVVDAGQRRPSLQRKVGAGLSFKDYCQQAKEGKIKHHGLPESTALIAEGLGWKLSEVQERIRPVIAKTPVKTRYVAVKRGQVLGVQQFCTGFVDGEPKIQLKLQMSVGVKKSCDEILIDGIPPIHIKIPGGIHGDLATPAIVVNSIPQVLFAPPGLYNATDCPTYFQPARFFPELASEKK